MTPPPPACTASNALLDAHPGGGGVKFFSHTTFSFIALFCFLTVSCSRKEKPYQQSYALPEKEYKWVTYKDPKYPFAVDYMDTRMRVRSILAAPPQDRLLPSRHIIAVDSDIDKEFPLLPQSGDPDLYDITIYETQQVFEEGPGRFFASKTTIEDVFNGIPVIKITDSFACLFLIPGLYATFGYNDARPLYELDEWEPETPKEKDFKRKRVAEYMEFYDRRDKIRDEAIKRFRWEGKSIDAQSEEFKKWRDHIWEILRSNKPKKS